MLAYNLGMMNLHMPNKEGEKPKKDISYEAKIY